MSALLIPGELLQLSLELAEDCHQKNDPPLATTRATVTVDFMPEGKGLGGEERSSSMVELMAW